MEKRETENTDELLYLSVVALHVLFFCSKLYNSISHTLGWKVPRVKWFFGHNFSGQCGVIQPEARIQCVYSMYVWGTYKMGLAPFRYGTEIQSVSKFQ